MSAATMSASESAASKAILMQALQLRLASLQKTVGQHKQAATNNNSTPAAATPQAPAPAVTVTLTPAAPRATAADAPPAAPLSALEQAKAMLAAKIAARAASSSASSVSSSSPSPSPPAAAVAASAPVSAMAAANAIKVITAARLSAQAKPFLPASAAASSDAASSTAATAVAASSSSPAAAAASSKPAIALHKTQLCRSWLTCTFGAKCRFRHPTVNTEPFFEYGGEVLLHLNAPTAIAIDPNAAYAAPTAMPPVLLLLLTLILQSGAGESGGASFLPLMHLWSSLKEQLQGCKELPANQDDMLNIMGLPTTAAVLQRAADGQSVLSTEAFRNMYACVFSICRQGGTFQVTHQWDEERRAQLQAALDLQRQQQERVQQKRAPPPSSTNQAFAFSGAGAGVGAASAAAAAAAAGADDDQRKRKRVTDAQLAGEAPFEPDSKKSRRVLGEAYPEEQAIQMRPAAAVAPHPAASSSSSSHGQYLMDAGEEMGGATSFVRGGIVTELSLLTPSGAAPSFTRQQLQAMRDAEADDDMGDAFTRAIRRQREVQTHATYTVRTQRISSGKGFDMLQRMNWKNGQGLGKRKQGRVDPVEVKFRADRTGL